MKGHFNLRMEYVIYLDRSWGIPQNVRAEDFFNIPALEKVFETYPVVVPYKDNDD